MTHFAIRAKNHALADLAQRGLFFSSVHTAIQAGAMSEQEWEELKDHYRGGPAGSGKPTQDACAVRLARWARRDKRPPAP